VVIVVGVGIALAALGSLHVSLEGLPRGVSGAGFEVFTDIVLPLVAAWMVLSVDRTDNVRIGHRRRGPLVRWALLGILVFSLLAVWASLEEIFAGDVIGVMGTLTLGANLGILFGAIAGINRARAMRNAELADRERTQREGLEFLNHLLRHHVLNGMTIINGYTDELRDQGVAGEHVAVIERQSSRIVTLVENVQTFVESLSGDVERRPIDVTAVARRCVTDARETYPRVTFALDVEETTAHADEFVRALLDNLVSNAVEHHDGTPPEVRVETRETDDSVRIRVADDGPGIPEATKASFADEDEMTTAISEDGLGLYLVHTLAENYGGTVRIEDREPRGTVVAVELPRA
jgi:signal transduction histidine kinase